MRVAVLTADRADGLLFLLSCSFCADSLRIVTSSARILDELEPSVAVNDDDDFEVLAWFLLHFSP